MSGLADRYRPASWDDVVGQEKVVKQLRGMSARGGLGGRSFFLSGKSGTGKTTIARLIATEVAESWNVEEMDAGDLTADTIRRIEAEMQLLGMGAKTGRAWIVNEVHGLNAIQVRKLLTLIEPDNVPAHVVFCFTTTVLGRKALFEGCDDASPLLSRCTVLELAQRGLAEAFAVRAREIAQAEALDGQPLEKYLRLVNDLGGNMRAVLQSIDAGEMLV